MQKNTIFFVEEKLLLNHNANEWVVPPISVPMNVQISLSSPAHSFPNKLTYKF